MYRQKEDVILEAKKGISSSGAPIVGQLGTKTIDSLYKMMMNPSFSLPWVLKISNISLSLPSPCSSLSLSLKGNNTNNANQVTATRQGNIMSVEEEKEFIPSNMEANNISTLNENGIVEYMKISSCPLIQKLRSLRKGVYTPFEIIESWGSEKDQPKITYAHISCAVIASIRLKDPESAILAYKKCTELGIQQTLWLYSMVMQAHIKSEKVFEAIQMYTYLRSNKISPLPIIVNSLLSLLIDKGAHKVAWEIFYELKAHFTLPTYLFAMMLKLCAKNVEIERALKLVRDMESDLITPSNYILESLLHLCASRKAFLEEANSIIKRLLNSGRPLHLTLSNCLLNFYATNGNKEKFYEIWRQFEDISNAEVKKVSSNLIKPNIYSFSALFKLLHNMPLSKRESQTSGTLFYYETTPTTILEEAKKYWNMLLSNCHIIPIQTFILNDFLRILCKYEEKEGIEFFFNQQFKVLKVRHDLHSYELMFDFYWKNNHYNSAIVLKSQVPSPSLISKRSWFCLIQTATKARDLDSAIELLSEMTRSSQKPLTLASLNRLHIAIVNAERWDLRSRLHECCLRESHHESDVSKMGKRALWDSRNDAINALLDFAYGRPGGESNVRGVYSNIKANITILPSDTNNKDLGFNPNSIPGYSSLMKKSFISRAPLPSIKKRTQNLQARKKRIFVK